MTFGAITKRKLFDHLHDCAKARRTCPSLKAIVKLTKLADDDAAERLLKSLQTDGVLHIIRAGPYPWVELQRNTYHGPMVRGITLDPEIMKVPAAAAKPAAAAATSSTKDTQGASGTARKASSAAPSGAATRIEDRAPIKAAAAGAPAPMAAAPIPERPAVETVAAQQDGPADASMSPASSDQGPRPAVLPAQAAEGDGKARTPSPQAVEARHAGGRPPTDNVARPKQLNVRLTESDMARITEHAAASGRSPSHEAVGLLREALGARRARHHSGGKYRVRAEVLCAWPSEHGPLDRFVETLIMMGLQQYLAAPEQVAA